MILALSLWFPDGVPGAAGKAARSHRLERAKSCAARVHEASRLPRRVNLKMAAISTAKAMEVRAANQSHRPGLRQI